MECSQCGSCCKTIAMFIGNMGPRQVAYLSTRGVERDGDWFLIPSTCQFLKDNKCTIHDHKPFICSRFHGQKEILGWKVYTPKNCVFREVRER